MRYPIGLLFVFIFSGEPPKKHETNSVMKICSTARTEIWWCAIRARQQKRSLKLYSPTKIEKRSEANRIRNHSHWSTDSKRMCTQMEMEKRNFIWIKKSFRFSINGRITNGCGCFFGICCKQRFHVPLFFSFCPIFYDANQTSAVSYWRFEWKFLILASCQLGLLQAAYGHRLG